LTFHDTAAVGSTAPFKPTGRVTYRFFATANCTGPGGWSQEVKLDGGAVPNSKSTAILDAGAYSFLATCGGDPNFHSSTAACEPFTVTAAPPVTNGAVY
jgi:hypothetical protein